MIVGSLISTQAEIGTDDLPQNVRDIIQDVGIDEAERLFEMPRATLARLAAGLETRPTTRVLARRGVELYRVRGAR